MLVVDPLSPVSLHPRARLPSSHMGDAFKTLHATHIHVAWSDPDAEPEVVEFMEVADA